MRPEVNLAKRLSKIFCLRLVSWEQRIMMTTQSGSLKSYLFHTVDEMGILYASHLPHVVMFTIQVCCQSQSLVLWVEKMLSNVLGAVVANVEKSKAMFSPKAFSNSSIFIHPGMFEGIS